MTLKKNKYLACIFQKQKIESLKLKTQWISTLNTAEERISKLEDSSENITQIAGQKETQMEDMNESLRNVEGRMRKYYMFLIEVSEWENREWERGNI